LAEAPPAEEKAANASGALDAARDGISSLRRNTNAAFVALLIVIAIPPNGIDAVTTAPLNPGSSPGCGYAHAAIHTRTAGYIDAVAAINGADSTGAGKSWATGRHARPSSAHRENTS